MASKSLARLKERLSEVDELISAHKVITGGHRGRPAKRQGAAITRAGVVLLAARMEAFVEDLFEEAGDLVFAKSTVAEREDLYRNTSRKLNNADSFKTNMLYFNLACPWILSSIKWRKFSNATFIKQLNKLVEIRGSIAHGKQPSVSLPQLRKWKTMVANYAPRLENAISEHIENMTGMRPAW